MNLEEQLNDEMEEHEGQEHPGQPPRDVCLRQAQSDEQGRGCGHVEMWMVNKYKKLFKKKHCQKCNTLHQQMFRILNCKKLSLITLQRKNKCLNYVS